MTMRLQLVIEGDPSGAKKAIEETGQAVEELGRKSEQAGKKAERAGGSFEWLSDEENRARLGLKSTGQEADSAAAGLEKAGEAAGKAAKSLADTGEAAATANPGLSKFSATLVGLAAGIGATVIAETFKLATTAAVDFFHEVTSNAPMIERALESHESLISRIKGAYAEAGNAASSYGLNAASVLRFEAQQNVGRLEGAVGAAQRDLYRGSDALRPSDTLGAPFARFGPMAEEVERFRTALRAGEADVIAFRESIAEIGETLPADSPLRAIAEKILADTEELARMQAELERSRDVLQGLKGDAEAAAAALGGSAEKYGDLAGRAGEASQAVDTSAGALVRSGEAAAGALPALREYDGLLRSIAAGGAAAFQSPARAALTPLTAGRQFSSGGYTGDGDVSAAAGIVHGQEFVVNAAATARHRPLLEAINSGLPGYAAGGYVTPLAGGGGRYAGGGGGYDILRGAARGVIVEVLSMARQGDFSRFWDMFANAGFSIADRLFSHWAGTLADNLVSALAPKSGGGVGGGLGGFIGNLFGGLFGGGTSYFPPAPAIGFHTLHDGGMAGFDSSGARFASPGVFHGAPRLHGGGLVPGEVPIIAMAGEEVGWPDQLARKYGRGAHPVQPAMVPSIRFEITDRAGVTIEQHGEARQDSDGGLTIPLLISELTRHMVASMQNGPLHQATASTFGLTRKTR